MTHQRIELKMLQKRMIPCRVKENKIIFGELSADEILCLADIYGTGILKGKLRHGTKHGLHVSFSL